MLFCCSTGVIVRISFSPLAAARHSHQTCRVASEEVRWITVYTHRVVNRPSAKTVPKCSVGEETWIDGPAGETLLWDRLHRSKSQVFCWVSFGENEWKLVKISWAGGLVKWALWCFHAAELLVFKEKLQRHSVRQGVCSVLFSVFTVI